MCNGVCVSTLCTWCIIVESQTSNIRTDVQTCAPSRTRTKALSCAHTHTLSLVFYIFINGYMSVVGSPRHRGLSTLADASAPKTLLLWGHRRTLTSSPSSSRCERRCTAHAWAAPPPLIFFLSAFADSHTHTLSLSLTLSKFHSITQLLISSLTHSLHLSIYLSYLSIC